MEHTAIRFIYHDGLAHYDKEVWRDVYDFSGWVVVQCNCKLVTKLVIMNARVEGLVSYLVHTQEKSDSVSEPATSKKPCLFHNVIDCAACEQLRNSYALENDNQRHETDGQEQSADSASPVQRADALPDEGQQESAASSTEPSEVN